MSEKIFSKEAAIKEAFNILKKNLGFVILLAIIWIVITNIPVTLVSASLQSELRGPNSKEALSKLFRFILYYLPVILIWSFVITPGLYKIHLKLTRNLPSRLSEIFTDFSTIVRLAIASFVLSFIVIIGFILLIVPGVYFALRFQLFGFLIVDKGLGPIEALKESWRLTEGKVGNLFVLGLIVFGIALLYSLASGLIILPFTLGGVFLSLANNPLSTALTSFGSILGLILKTPLYPFALLVSAQVYEKLSPSISPSNIQSQTF